MIYTLSNCINEANYMARPEKNPNNFLKVSKSLKIEELQMVSFRLFFCGCFFNQKEKDPEPNSMESLW